MATKTKKTKTNTTSNRSNATTICGNANTTSTKRNPIGRPATVTAQMAKGAMGASKPPKPVARPSGGTKMGGGKPAGRKGGKGC